MTYRILDNPNVPNEQKGHVAADGIRWLEERAKAEQDKQDAARQKQEQIKETLAVREAEGKKRQEIQDEEKRKKEAAVFENEVRADFFENNPAASEDDWNRNRRQCMDQERRARASGQSMSRAKRRLLESGRYSGL